MPHSPGDEYRRRLQLRRASHDALTALDARFGYARLTAFGVLVAIAGLAWQTTLSWWWLALPMAAFGWLVQRHDAVIRARVAAARGILFYERGLARVEDRWAGTGEPGDRFRDDGHLYANDLDLFGPASLFELLSIARTRAGEATLAAWLKTPARPIEISSRHEAVAELTSELDLRETVALAGTDVRAGVDTEALVAWAEGPAALRPGWTRRAAVALTVAAVGAGAAWFRTGDALPFVVVVGLEIGFFARLRARVEAALHAAGGPARDLDVLAHVLTHLETHRVEGTRLRLLQATLQAGDMLASAAIRRLHRFVEWHDWQHNTFFAPFASTLLWGTHLAFAIEGWRERHGCHVRDWLDTVGQFEALSSLAAYSYEHPDDPFPTILEQTGAVFEGDDLGHPLIPAARMVRNDVRLSDSMRLLIVSGSNMSGKSTLLRTCGINVVLALAGAPVRARSLRLTPLVVGATLRIQDSLQEGRSRFYAEISRVRALSDAAAGATPLLFLLDELFHGTNSHDRLAGASGVLRSLLDRGAIGLITTHDLALTKVADDLAPRARNVHFDDRFEGGEIRFDYRMKSGPVTHSNALALMRAVGLDVDLGRHQP